MMGFWDLVRASTGVSMQSEQRAPNAWRPPSSTGGTSRQTAEQQGLRQLKEGEYPVPEGAPGGGYWTTNTRDGKESITGYAYEKDGKTVVMPTTRAEREAARLEVNQAVVRHSDFLNEARGVASDPGLVSGMSTQSGYEASRVDPAAKAEAAREAGRVRDAARAAAASPGLISGMSTSTGFNAVVQDGAIRLPRGPQTGDQRLQAFLTGSEAKLKNIPVIGESIRGEEWLRRNAPQGGGVERLATDVLTTGYMLSPLGWPAAAGRGVFTLSAAGQRLAMAPKEFFAESKQGNKFIYEETGRQMRQDPIATGASAAVVVGGFLGAPKAIRAQTAALSRIGGTAFGALPRGARLYLERDLRPKSVTVSVGGKSVARVLENAGAYELESVTMRQRVLTGGRQGAGLRARESLTFNVREIPGFERKFLLSQGVVKTDAGALSLSGVGTQRSLGFMQSPLGQRLYQGRVVRGPARLSVDAYGNLEMVATRSPSRLAPRFARYAELRQSAGAGELAALLFKTDVYQPGFSVRRFAPGVSARLPSFAGSGAGRMLGGDSYAAAASFSKTPRVLREFAKQFTGSGEARAGGYRSFTLRLKSYSGAGRFQLPGSVVSGRLSGVVFGRAGALVLQRQKLPVMTSDVSGLFLKRYPGAFGFNEVQRSGFGWRRLGKMLPFQAGIDAVEVGAGSSKSLQRLRKAMGVSGRENVYSGGALKQYMERGMRVRVRAEGSEEYVRASLRPSELQAPSMPSVRQAPLRSLMRSLERFSFGRMASLSNAPRQRMQSMPSIQSLTSRLRGVEKNIAIPGLSLRQIERQSQIPRYKLVEDYITKMPPIERLVGEPPVPPLDPVPNPFRWRIPTPWLGGGGSGGSGGASLAAAVGMPSFGRRRGKYRIQPEADLFSKLMSNALFGKATVKRASSRKREFLEEFPVGFSTDQLRGGRGVRALERMVGGR